MRVGIHLLGSRHGYRTLAASDDVTVDERHALEALDFGQSADAAFLHSLESEPSAFLRHLPSGRLSLTRLFAGPPDDANRATLELRTLLLQPDDYARLIRSDLERTLSAAALWTRARFEGGRSIDVSPPPAGQAAAVGRFELLVMDGWLRAAEHGRATAVLEDSLAHRRAIFGLLRTLAHRDLLGCRWGVRMLSVACGVELATIMPRADRGHREFIAIDRNGQPAIGSIRFLFEANQPMSAMPPSERLRVDSNALAASAARARDGERDRAATRASGVEGGGRQMRRTAIMVLALVMGALMLATVITLVVMRGSPSSSRRSDGATARDRTETVLPAEPSRRPHAESSGRASAASGEERRGNEDRDRAPFSIPPPSLTPAAPTTQPTLPTVPTTVRPAAPPTPPTTAPSTAPAPVAPVEDSTTPGASTPTAPASNAVDGAETLERIARNRNAAERETTTIADATKALQAALLGPDEKTPWNDHPVQWSKEHCERVAAAIDRHSESLAVMALAWNADAITELARVDAARPLESRERFLDSAVVLVDAIEALDRMRREGEANALATHTSAMSAFARANCAGDRFARTRDQSSRVMKTLRPLIGADGKGRPQLDRVNGLRRRLSQQLRAGLDRHAESLDASLVAELRRVAAP